MKKFDSHVHIFPDKLLGKVLPKLSVISNCPYHSDGTLNDALNKLKEAKVDDCLFLNIATNVKQEESVNNFAFELAEKGYNAFGSVHPDSPQKIETLHKIKEKGLKGIKIHPDYQGFTVDESKMSDIYAECQKLGLIVAMHAGWDPLSPNEVHCHPKNLRSVALSYPNLKIIAAHMGGMRLQSEVAKHLAGLDNVWFDTAFASFFMNSDELYELIKLHGVEKILFATDLPWSTAINESNLIENSKLNEDEKRAIYYYNAAKLLSLE